MLIELVVVVLMLRPDFGQVRVAEVVLPPGTALSECQGAGAQQAAMIVAERATGWYSMATGCVVRHRT